MRLKESIWMKNLAENQYFRRAHTSLLATPNYRRTQKVPLRETPSISIGEPIWPVRKSAMNTTPSPRVRKLSVSKHKLRDEEEAKNPPIVQDHLGTFSHGGYLYKKSGRRGRATNRVKMLATPKLTTMVNNLTEYRKRLGRPFAKRLNRQITTALRQNYTSLYVRPSNVLQVGVQETKSENSISSKEDWRRHRLWLSERASARVIKIPPLPPRKTRPLEQLLVRIEEMARPSERHIYSRMESSPNVLETALNYEITPRLLKIAKPKIYDASKGPVKEFMGVTVAAKHYVASDRIVKISEPRPRSNFVDPDMKEDPYKINPFALTAKCPARTLQLAKPRKTFQ